MSLNSEQYLPEIGYLYHYPRLDHPTDNFRLDIYINNEPTEKHFDVLRTQFPAVTITGDKERLKVNHPWKFKKTHSICAGIVIMEDRKGKREDAFTFGGQLMIDSQEFQTVCVLVSSAPILEISEATAIHRLFIDEVEILLARKQAEFKDYHAYEKLLIKIDPQALYLACLEALLEKYERSPHEFINSLHLLVYLHSQKHRFKAAGLSRTPSPRLDDLFET